MRRDSFILRIWREESQKEWQGWVQHIPSGESVPVRNMDELQSFIERTINDQQAQTTPRGLK